MTAANSPTETVPEVAALLKDEVSDRSAAAVLPVSPLDGATATPHPAGPSTIDL
ncbi:MAG: hypothetical protein F6J97_24330, partial [Leptolyngbya sp. SIO4C1]|nr:hypothetical protein [Leptolyngbya sp. SIO4C1]